MWDVDLSTLKVGDEVMARKPIYEGPDEHGPGGCFCQALEKLIVRSIGGSSFPISVSHPHITDNSFGVKLEEIAIYNGGQHEDA